MASPEIVGNITHVIIQGLQVIRRGYSDDQVAHWRDITNGNISPQARDDFRSALCRDFAAIATNEPPLGRGIDPGSPIINFGYFQSMAEAIRTVDALSPAEINQRIVDDAQTNLQRFNLL